MESVEPPLYPQDGLGPAPKPPRKKDRLSGLAQGAVNKKDPLSASDISIHEFSLDNELVESVEQVAKEHHVIPEKPKRGRSVKLDDFLLGPRMRRIRADVITSPFMRLKASILTLHPRFKVVKVGGRRHLLDVQSIKEELVKEDKDLDQFLEELQNEDESSDLQLYLEIKAELTSDSMRKIGRLSRGLKEGEKERVVVRARSGRRVTVIIGRGKSRDTLVLFRKTVAVGGFSRVFQASNLIRRGDRSKVIKTPYLEGVKSNIDYVRHYDEKKIVQEIGKKEELFLEIWKEELGVKKWNLLEPKERVEIYAKALWRYEAYNAQKLLLLLQGIDSVESPYLIVRNIKNDDLGLIEGVCYDGDGTHDEVLDLPLEKKLQLFQPLVFDLQKIHKRGVHLGDIKPTNFLYHRGPPGKLYFSDFGGSCLVDEKNTRYASTLTSEYLPESSSFSSGGWMHVDGYSLAVSMMAMITKMDGTEGKETLLQLMRDCDEGPDKECLRAILRVVNSGKSKAAVEKMYQAFAAL